MEKAKLGFNLVVFVLDGLLVGGTCSLPPDLNKRSMGWWYTARWTLFCQNGKVENWISSLYWEGSAQPSEPSINLFDTLSLTHPLLYILHILLSPGTARRGNSTRYEVPEHGQPVLESVRRRRCQPGPGVWGVQHGQAVGPAMRIHLWKQQVWHGHSSASSRRLYRVLQQGRLHSRTVGK